MITTPMAWRTRRSRCLHLSNINTDCFNPIFNITTLTELCPHLSETSVYIFRRWKRTKNQGTPARALGKPLGWANICRISHYHRQGRPEVLRSGKNDTMTKIYTKRYLKDNKHLQQCHFSF